MILLKLYFEGGSGNEEIRSYYGWRRRNRVLASIQIKNAKQLLNITGDDLMINETIKRIIDLLPIEKALIAAEDLDKLITVGIKPTFPSIGYGYIQYSKWKQSFYDNAFEVENFIENTSIEKANSFQQLI